MSEKAKFGRAITPFILIKEKERLNYVWCCDN